MRRRALLRGLLSGLLAGVAATGAAAAGRLRVEATGPLPTSGLGARVIGRDGALAALVRAGDSEELPAGVYRVELLTDPPLVRSQVTVAREGETLVRFTELGALRVVVEGAAGEALSTVAEVFLADGRRLDTIASGSERMLPAGSYRVVVRSKPNRTFPKVVVTPGKIAEVAVRLGAAIRLEAVGPDGKPVAVNARVVHPDGSVLGFATGESLSLPPGEYDVSLDTVPPSRRRVKLEAGAVAVLRVDDLGALLLELADPSGATGARVDCAVTVLDPASGLVVARARNGDRVVVRPGRYRARFETRPPVVVDDLTVGPRQVRRAGAPPPLRRPRPAPP